MNTTLQRVNLNSERVALSCLPYIPRIAALLVVVSTIAAFLYGTFLLEAVGQAASRTTAMHRIHDLSSELGILEGQYLTATADLTPERAQALGYVTPAQVSTVLIDANTTSLSFVNH